MSAHLVLIDGPSIFHIAYHSRPNFEHEGQPVGALKGFVDFIWNVLHNTRDFGEVTHMAVAFEGKRNFRRALSPAYKANRTEHAMELVSQVRLIKQATRALGIAVLEETGYEADDMIGTYARVAQRIPADDVTIISRDKDFMQLIDAYTTLYDPIKRSHARAYDVTHKFGVEPYMMVDLLALMGDVVDGVQGVPGIGPKKGAALLREYGTLDNLLSRLAVVTSSKMEDLIVAHAQNVRLARELVRIDRYAPESVSIEELKVDPDKVKFAAFLKSWGINWMASKVDEGGYDQQERLDSANI